MADAILGISLGLIMMVIVFYFAGIASVDEINFIKRIMQVGCKKGKGKGKNKGKGGKGRGK